MVWILLEMLLLAAAAAVLSYRCFRDTFYCAENHRPDPFAPIRSRHQLPYADRIRSGTAAMASRPCEEITVTATDGTSLFGRYYGGPADRPLAILFHGYRSTAFRDCYGGLELADKLGYRVLAVDQRAHGRSGGTVITFGIRERLDSLCWADYAQAHLAKGQPILLAGVSMGAATVLMAADLPLPDSVCGIIADCPYTAPDRIIRTVCRSRRFPVACLYPFIALGARLFGGFRLTEASALRAVAGTRLPILLIHGEADGFVPCAMSRELHAAAPTSTLVTFPGAAHALSQKTDPERYEAAVAAFLAALS